MTVDDGDRLTPEQRGRHRARAQFDRQFARVKPGSYAFEIFKRAALGVYTNGFMYAGNLAYLALMTVFPFFIVAAAVLSILGQSSETQRAVASLSSRSCPPMSATSCANRLPM